MDGSSLASEAPPDAWLEVDEDSSSVFETLLDLFRTVCHFSSSVVSPSPLESSEEVM